MTQQDFSKFQKKELAVLEQMYKDYSEMTDRIYKIISEYYQLKNSKS